MHYALRAHTCLSSSVSTPPGRTEKVDVDGERERGRRVKKKRVEKRGKEQRKGVSESSVEPRGMFLIRLF